VELAVVDNGPGITQENLTKVLEPLFTTKDFGTGLGLPAVQNILAQHGGGLDIASREGEGATFTAWFPVETSPPEIKNAA
jgi:signal transduction histidine kinase